MKKVLFLVVLSLVVLDAKSSDTIKVKSKVKEATIFFSGAEIVHETGAQLAKGINELVIQGLSPDIEVNSIRIRASTGVLISSFEFTVESAGNDDEIKNLQNVLDEYNAHLNKIKSMLQINNRLMSTLQNAVDKSSDNTENRAENIINLIEYYNSKMKDTEENTFQLKAEEKELNKKIAETNTKIRETNSKIIKDKGAIKLTLSSPSDMQCTFNLMYYTPLASWSPYHDINVSNLDSPVKITSKAKVKQTTGVDWEQVKLKLSTSAPSFGTTAPLFRAWILQQPKILANTLNSSKREAMMQNIISYKELQIDEIVEEEELDENAIVETMDDHVAVSENNLNITYDIDLPYSIAGDGKVRNIELKTQEITAEYKHYCAPKLNLATFLIAEIKDWETLNLLNGNANITYDNTFVSETYIDAASTKNALSLTLGIDARVAVKREKVNEMSSAKLFGNDIRQEFTYRITVRNNHNKPVNIVVKDQYPKSTEKQVEVSLLKNTTTPTFNNEDVGVISWEEKLKQGESKTYNISYSVKYPKGAVLNLPY
ncbi:MAG: mucoidy inhibitor MuiA family protein [Planctomycetaceae bacterium]|jgi:uncharacterized protein (TIGR02231 family)|nr:mucoidy inhibitor MuiA family protein [Planctomycetaceae bacterium]